MTQFDTDQSMYHSCEECGKRFYVGIVDKWAWQKRKYGSGNKTAWFCSYKCMRAYEKKREKPRGESV